MVTFTRANGKVITFETKKRNQLQDAIDFYRAQSIFPLLEFQREINAVPYYVQVEYIAGDKIYVITGEGIEAEEFASIALALEWINGKHEPLTFFSLTHIEDVGEDEQLFSSNVYPSMVNVTDDGEERLLVRSWGHGAV